MKNIIKKVILFILILLSFIVVASIFLGLKQNQNEEYKSEIIDNNNVKVLQIDNSKIINLSERSGDNSLSTTKVKNISDFNLSQIEIHYNEMDKNEKVISNSKIFINISLIPQEVMQIKFTPKDYTDSIEITGYTYIAKDCNVVVDLKNNSSEIYENKRYLENSKIYDVIAIKKIGKSELKESDLNYSIKIKNISDKNLGNIVLKVAEIDKNEEIVRIDHITYNSILEKNQSDNVISCLHHTENDIKILGYTYDDIENKNNVDVDLIINKATITDDEE